MSAKNDILLKIEEIVIIYANSKYLDRNVRWILFILAEYINFPSRARKTSHDFSQPSQIKLIFRDRVGVRVILCVHNHSETKEPVFILCFPVGYREISVKIFFDLTLVPPVKIPIFMFLLPRLIARASHPDGNMTVRVPHGVRHGE